MTDEATQGLNVFLVGGAVRDQLLEHPWHERDWVVVGATPEQMQARGFRSVGKDFPVFLHPDTHEEYALARTERKSGHGYTGFIVKASPEVTLEEDLGRRDLTLNAIAQAADGTLIDPYHGIADLRARKLRHVSEAFGEDPLRVLRAARFLARYAVYGFSVAEETETLIKKMVASGELGHLVAERVWKETAKALEESDPCRYFELLARTKALPIIMPLLTGAALETGCSRVQAFLAAQPKPVQPMVVWALLMSGLSSNVINELCRRLKTPNDIRLLAEQLAILLELWSTAEPLTPQQLMAGFNRLDIWRQPDRLARLLPLLHHCGLTIDGQQVVKLAEKVRAVSPQQFVAAGYKGAALGEAIAAKRMALITQTLQNRAMPVS